MPKNDDMIRENSENIDEITQKPDTDNNSDAEKKDLFARSSAADNLLFGEAEILSSDDEGDDLLQGFDISDKQDDKDSQEADDAAPVKEKVKVKVVRERGLGIRSIAFSAAYIVIVVMAALFLAYYAITRANDAFAFVKDPYEASVEISNVNMSLDELSELLYNEGVIEYPGFFKLYVMLKNDGEFNLKKGTYTVSAQSNYDVILSALNPYPKRAEIWITIPEGYTTDDIINLFVSKGIGTREGFYDTIQNAEFNYWFIEPLNESISEDRYYRLDGYLYPDTYCFYTTSSEKTVLTKLLNNFNKKVAREYEQRCEELGITLDEAIIFASMIQKEARYAADYQFVSAVFHNRMKNVNYPRFDCDATLQYYYKHTEGAYRTDGNLDVSLDSPYNTRKYGGFPPGPICSPSLTAIKAALYPSNKNFYYFISKPSGYLVYSSTYSQHMRYAAMTPSELSKVDQGLYGGD